MFAGISGARERLVAATPALQPENSRYPWLVLAATSLATFMGVLDSTIVNVALNTLTVAFSRRLGPTVRVNAIMCGPFFTEVSEHWDMDEFSARVARHSLHRGGQPYEIVGTALYLASDASSFTTGAVIPVNGGEV